MKNGLFCSSLLSFFIISALGFRLFLPGFLVQRGLFAALSSGWDAQCWTSEMRDHLLLEAGAAYTKTLALIFMAKSRPQGFWRVCVVSTSSPWVSVHWRCVWSRSWVAPQWPPPLGRAADSPEPSEDISPPMWTGWPSWGRCLPTGVERLF